MSWFNTQSAKSERILFSKACYTRNIAKLPFGSGADTKKLTEISQRAEKVLSSTGFRGERIAAGNNAVLLSLAEKQFASPELVFGDGARVIYLNEPCNLTVSIGGRELISIQSIIAGQAVIDAQKSAAVAEELLDGELTFAYSERIGYLSPFPERCGSGLELSAALYLPSVRLLDNYESLRRALLRRDARLSPMFTHKYNPGDIYILSYSPPHLANEQYAAMYFDSMLSELSALDDKNQKMLYPDNSDELLDSAFRALGILKNARKMDECEMLRLISDIRLCLCLCENVGELPSVTDLNFLSVEGLNCSLITSSNKKCTSDDDLSRIRASFLQKYIFAKVAAEA